MKIGLILVLCLGLLGCALTASIKREQITHLMPNMTTDEVRRVMGDPFSTETYLSSDNKTNLIWNYRTHYSTDALGVTHQELTPLVFKDNLLLGWGNNFYDQLVQPNKAKLNARIGCSAKREESRC